MSFLYGVIFGVLLLFGFAIFLIPSDSATIPPTKAFYQIIINDSKNVTSSNYKDTLYLNSTDPIILNVNNQTITISLNSPSLTSIGGLFSSSCTVGKMVSGIGTDGYVECEDLPNPTPTRHGGLRLSSCPSGQFVSGIDGSGFFECDTP